MAPAHVRIGARQVSRRFGSVVANDRVDLEVAPGTIHGVIGENGAGKTTLMRILYGLECPDEGTVVIDDRPVALSNPRDALARGIGMVQQELSLIPELSLLENLVLDSEPMRGPLIDWEAARQRAAALAERVGVELDWDISTARAPVSTRQRLEILRLLYRGADVLILDEPTAVLAPPQVAELFALLRDLAAQGHTVVFISHKLDEVLTLAEAVTVLRGGCSVARLATEQTTAGELAELMVGAELAAAPEPVPREPGPTVLDMRGLRARDDRDIERLVDVDLTVRSGEIVGVAGVAGNGQDELLECVVGLRRPTGGQILVGAADVTRQAVASRRARGLAYISPDRKGEGLAVTASLTANTIAGHHAHDPLSRGGWLRPRRVTDFVQRALQRFGVIHGRVSAPALSLSGGNQQRVVLARELDEEPALLVAAQPTRGVDVKGIAFVQEQLLRLRQAGTAILLVSEELDELLALSDRVVVLYRGALAGEVGPGEQRRTRLAVRGWRDHHPPRSRGHGRATPRRLVAGGGRRPRRGATGARRAVPVPAGARGRGGDSARHRTQPAGRLCADVARGGGRQQQDRLDIVCGHAAAVHRTRHGDRLPRRGVQHRRRGQLRRGRPRRSGDRLHLRRPAGTGAGPRLAVRCHPGRPGRGPRARAAACRLGRRRGRDDAARQLHRHRHHRLPGQHRVPCARGGKLGKPLVAEHASLARLLPPSTLHLGVLIALVAVVAYGVLLHRSTLGFELRMVGVNPVFCQAQGISVARTVLLAMLLSGAVGGLGGGAHALGVVHRFVEGFSAEYGFAGIAVALLGRNSAVGVLLAALLFGGLTSAGSTMQLFSDIPLDLVNVLQGVVMIFAVVQLVRDRSRLRGAD